MNINRVSLRKLPVSRDFLLKQFQEQAVQDMKKKLVRNLSDATISKKIKVLREQQLQQLQANQQQQDQLLKSEIHQKRSSLPQNNVDNRKAYEIVDNNNFKQLYTDHINFVVSKNPEYFEHLSGKCKCFKSNFLKRCGGMDQNQYKQSSKISSTYGNDFIRSRSNIDPRAAQLKSDPHQSSFYDFGTKKYFMNSQTIANIDYNNKYFPKTTAFVKPIKKNQIEGTEADKEPMLYTRSHYDQEFQGLVCPPVIPYHKLIHSNDNYLEKKNPFKFTSKSIYGTSFYNWSDRFIPNPVYDKTKLLGIFSTSMPFQARSTTKTSYSQEHAKIKEVEKPMKYEYVPQSIPAFKRQFISTANGDYGRIKIFKQGQTERVKEDKNHIIDQIKSQLSNIQNSGGHAQTVIK